MADFKIRVEVVDAAGNVSFGLTVPATRDDLFFPGHCTPAGAAVFARLAEAGRMLLGTAKVDHGPTAETD